MAGKQSGLGDNLYVDGIDLSGDISAIDQAGGGPAMLDVTSIKSFGMERIGGLRDGDINYTSFFDNAVGAAHPTLSTLPTADRVMTYCRGTTLGNPSANIVAKQIGYDPKRDGVGNLAVSIAGQANQYGLDWAIQLTAGMRTDTAATNGTSVDQITVSTAFGWQAYLHLNAFSGTDVTVKLQDSADNSSFTDLASGAFTQITTTTPRGQRLAVGGTAVVRRYIRAVTVTTAGFTSATFAVSFTRNTVKVVF
jgi:hypothetical protein